LGLKESEAYNITKNAFVVFVTQETIETVTIYKVQEMKRRIMLPNVRADVCRAVYSAAQSSSSVYSTTNQGNYWGFFLIYKTLCCLSNVWLSEIFLYFSM